MCVMAAYVGEGPAAPVLLRILANMEGYGGGHFSGLATLHEGKLYYAKTCGDVATLLKETDAASLPGNVGIVHSRTPGHPNNEYAHPFITCDEKVAYVANGIVGLFGDQRKSDEERIHRRLTTAGKTFRTEYYNPEHKGATPMYNGNVMHDSDLMCGLIAEKHFDEGHEMAEAMRLAYAEFPGEIAGLAVAVDAPGQVSACRINQPLVWARRKGASFLATTALGLVDEQPAAIAPVPAGVSAVLRQDGLELTAMPCDVQGTHCAPPWAQAVRLLDAFMADGQPHHVGQMANALTSLWPKGQLCDSVMLAYQYAYELVQAGGLKVVRTTAPASRPGAQAPRWLFQKA